GGWRRPGSAGGPAGTDRPGSQVVRDSRLVRGLGGRWGLACLLLTSCLRVSARFLPDSGQEFPEIRERPGQMRVVDRESEALRGRRPTCGATCGATCAATCWAVLLMLTVHRSSHEARVALAPGARTQ